MAKIKKKPATPEFDLLIDEPAVLPEGLIEELTSTVIPHTVHRFTHSYSRQIVDDRFTLVICSKS
jgi:hypothetical protein